MYVTVAGWRGQGCHVITVNDYLAKRDAEWMGQIYRFCGLSVGYIDADSSRHREKPLIWQTLHIARTRKSPPIFCVTGLHWAEYNGLSSALLERISGKNSKITDRLIQRRLNCAIVDEADSVLIDESVTPLIISGNAPNPQQVDSFQQAAEIASQLIATKIIKLTIVISDVELTEKGKEHIDELTEVIWVVSGKVMRRSLELVNQALIAKELYHA